ncbi:hypothetical protein L915_12868, partial [Phytophthora nicotianae]
SDRPLNTNAEVTSPDGRMFTQSDSIGVDWEDLDATILVAGNETFLCASDKHIGSVEYTSSLTSSTSDNAESGEGKSCRATETRSRRSRREQKHELEEMRRQASVLNGELLRLYQIKENEKAVFNAAQTANFWLWKSVAMQQRHERALAEEEQRELTVTAQIQATYIRILNEIIQKQEDASFTNRTSDDYHRNQCFESDMLESFIQELDSFDYVAD